MFKRIDHNIVGCIAFVVLLSMFLALELGALYWVRWYVGV
jgi:hypothetical protein